MYFETLRSILHQEGWQSRLTREELVLHLTNAWKALLAAEESSKTAINFAGLTAAQRMTLRVALAEFCCAMSKENALGEDQTGETIRLGYLKNTVELLQLDLTSPSADG